MASRNGHLEIVRILLEKGANMEAHDDVRILMMDLVYQALMIWFIILFYGGVIAFVIIIHVELHIAILNLINSITNTINLAIIITLIVQLLIIIIINIGWIHISDDGQL